MDRTSCVPWLTGGAAIVANANHRLDYFGPTVNLAARLEKHSRGGDVVIAETLLTDPRLAEAIGTVELERFRASVADVDESMRLVRLRSRV
ncbi:MAG: adenylate/guanylate cyclase domain-containing protein [Fimbriimonas sp.]